MFRFAFAIALTGLALAAAPARAQDTSGPSDSARYTFYRVQDIFLRLDVRTGQVSQCGWDASGWFCRVVPDERAALESEISRLMTGNTVLKKELLAHGVALPDGIKPDPTSGSRNNGGFKLPGDAEVDRAMGYVEKVWRRLVDMMVNLQRDMLRKS